ncbi:MAG: CHRD domain-containing protein [Betaproteobacteria bacterium]|nr:CHRD domain-containing protein [Betaproteobacteria bacterium]
MINIHESTSPNRLFTRIIPLALLLLASANLYAEQPIEVTLTGSTVVPTVTTIATGTGQFTVTPDHKVIGSIKVYDMTPTMAEIHEAQHGQNGPSIITLGKIANDSYAVPPDATLSNEQYASYLAGDLYVQVHSAKYPNGELRAQLLPKMTVGQSNRSSY